MIHILLRVLFGITASITFIALGFGLHAALVGVWSLTYLAATVVGCAGAHALVLAAQIWDDSRIIREAELPKVRVHRR